MGVFKFLIRIRTSRTRNFGAPLIPNKKKMAFKGILYSHIQKDNFYRSNALIFKN